MASETAVEREGRASLSRDKGDDRININNLISTVNLGIVAFMVSGDRGTISPCALSELAIALPFLLTSSLAYSKLRYRRLAEYPYWDRFGWFTHSVGYVATLDAIGVMLHHAGHPMIAWLFIGIVISLFLCYSAMDATISPRRTREKARKLGLYFFLIVLGYVVPIVLGKQ